MKKKERKNKELFFETVDIVFVDHYWSQNAVQTDSTNLQENMRISVLSQHQRCLLVHTTKKGKLALQPNKQLHKGRKL